MNEINRNREPRDADVRHAAIHDRDRNLVVVAGAGTGKTTLLVDRILALILGSSPIAVTQILAMTFTQKAANEMRQRLTERLNEILACTRGRPLSDGAGRRKGGTGFQPMESHGQDGRATAEKLVMELHEPPTRRSTGKTGELCRAALEQIDRAMIETMHGFASNILKEYALDAGVDPAFEVDEGDAFEETFEKEWKLYLDTELSLESPHRDVWLDILAKVKLESVTQLARELSAHRVDLEALARQVPEEAFEVLLAPVFSKAIPRLEQLLKRCVKQSEKGGTGFQPVESHCQDGRATKTFENLCTLLGAIRELSAEGLASLKKLPHREIDELPNTTKPAKTAWPEKSDRDAIVSLYPPLSRLVKEIAKFDEKLLSGLLGVTVPFARRMRGKLLEAGFVSFDGLLFLARNLLRDNPAVRSDLKRRFSAVLVDEFQDTDPLQYEIVLYLCEVPERCEKDIRPLWHGHPGRGIPRAGSPCHKRIRLVPGKLFIVGDPKQSIYAFRNADIEAYQRVSKQIVSDGAELELEENFRSHSRILDAVNSLFEKVIVEKEGLQPRYVPISSTREPSLRVHGIELVIVEEGENSPKLTADLSRQAEGKWIAEWIAKNRGETRILDEGGKEQPLEYRHIAILMRKLTAVEPYLDALRDSDIPYVVEGEKFFYSNQEVIDLVNILRAIANADDKLALVGVLRSPVAGISDRTIARLAEEGMLDYRKEATYACETPDVGRVARASSPWNPTARMAVPQGRGSSYSSKNRDARTVNRIFGRMRELSREALRRPVDALLDGIFEETCFLETIAAGRHGEQKVANIMKLRRIASEVTAGGPMSLRKFVRTLQKRVEEVEEEGESPLSDETVDAVKVLSIHKAKGLEFPVVILPDLSGERRRDVERDSAKVSFDWSTSKVGIAVGEISNLENASLREKIRERQEEEEKRVLYVAMTRARERLIMTSSARMKEDTCAGIIRKAIRETSGADILETAGILNIGDGVLEVSHTTLGAEAPRRRRKRRVARASSPWDPTARMAVPQARLEKVAAKLVSAPHWDDFARTWERRGKAFEAARQIPLHTSPSRMIGREERIPEEELEREVARRCAADARVVGTLCHRVLEDWDYAGNEKALVELIARLLPIATALGVPEEDIPRLESIVEEILLNRFFDSDAYRELATSRILAKELPFAMPWNGQVMEGRIDVIYQEPAEQNRDREGASESPRSGKSHAKMVVADYKTDDVAGLKLHEHAQRYDCQKKIYLEAARECAGLAEATFKVIFLRAGKAIEF